MLRESEFPPLPSQMRRKTGSSSKQSDGHKASRQVMKRQQSATTLTDLPDELLVEVLDYLLVCYSGKKAQLRILASLSRTNRRLHHIVSDRLYAVFDSRLCKAYPFLRTMVSNLSLASHVKSVSLSYGKKLCADQAYSPSVTDKQLMKNGFKQLDLPSWKVWASDCNGAVRQEEVLYAAILMHTPNVEHLDVDDGAVGGRVPHWLTNLRHVVNGHAIGRMHRFEHLRSIRVDLEFLKLRHLAPVFKLQSMRTVILIGLVEWMHVPEDESEVLQRLFPARASMVEDLQLEESYVEDDLLHVLLSCMRNLKAFQYFPSDENFEINGHGSAEYWGRLSDRRIGRYDDEYVGNAYGKVVESLGNHSKSLERFSWHNGRERPAPYGPGGDLSKFSRLAHVEIPVGLLTYQPTVQVSDLGERLPPSVQSLTLVWWGERQKNSLDYLILNWQQFVPSLKKLKVVHRVWKESPLHLIYQKISELCQAKDMPFSIEEVDENSDEGRNRPFVTSSSESDTSGEESLYSD